MAGHRFSTQSDTEILVHGWEEWGEDLLNELRGMFAFALLDLRKHYATVPVLLLARDPLGIKPLYYAQTSEGFAFASELRALIASKLVGQKISPDALTSYLLFGSVSEPVTFTGGRLFAATRAPAAAARAGSPGAPRERGHGGIRGKVPRRGIADDHAISLRPPRAFARCWTNPCART